MRVGRRWQRFKHGLRSRHTERTHLDQPVALLQPGLVGSAARPDGHEMQRLRILAESQAEPLAERGDQYRQARWTRRRRGLGCGGRVVGIALRVRVMGRAERRGACQPPPQRARLRLSRHSDGQRRECERGAVRWRTLPARQLRVLVLLATLLATIPEARVGERIGAAFAFEGRPASGCGGGRGHRPWLARRDECVIEGVVAKAGALRAAEIKGRAG